MSGEVTSSRYFLNEAKSIQTNGAIARKAKTSSTTCRPAWLIERPGANARAGLRLTARFAMATVLPLVRPLRSEQPELDHADDEHEHELDHGRGRGDAEAHVAERLRHDQDVQHVRRRARPAVGQDRDRGVLLQD